MTRGASKNSLRADKRASAELSAGAKTRSARTAAPAARATLLAQQAGQRAAAKDFYRELFARKPGGEDAT